MKRSRLVTTILAGGASAPTDTTRPTCVITCDAVSPSAAATFNYTITFSEVVTGFEVGDFGITGGSKGALGGSGAVYTCAVTPTGNAPVVATVAEGVAQDAAGNTNTAATPVSIGIIVTLTYQPDPTAGIDTTVESALADTAFGARYMKVQTGKNGLIKFPISLGAGASVQSGTLSVWNDNQTSGEKTVSVARVLAANNGWDEASTWNYKTPSTVRWAGDAASDGGADAGCSVSGTDYSATPLGSFTSAANAATGTQHDTTLNATELGLMCANNYGLILSCVTAVDFRITSSDSGTAGARPKLVIVVQYNP